MSISLSNRVNAVKPSPTLAITARAAQMRAAGKDIIGLGAGEPDLIPQILLNKLLLTPLTKVTLNTHLLMVLRV